MDALASHVTETVHDGILLKGLVGKPEVYRIGRKKEIWGQVAMHLKSSKLKPCKSYENNVNLLQHNTNLCVFCILCA